MISWSERSRSQRQGSIRPHSSEFDRVSLLESGHLPHAYGCGHCLGVPQPSASGMRPNSIDLTLLHFLRENLWAGSPLVAITYILVIYLASRLASRTHWTDRNYRPVILARCLAISLLSALLLRWTYPVDVSESSKIWWAEIRRVAILLIPLIFTNVSIWIKDLRHGHEVVSILADLLSPESLRDIIIVSAIAYIHWPLMSLHNRRRLRRRLCLGILSLANCLGVAIWYMDLQYFPSDTFIPSCSGRSISWAWPFNVGSPLSLP